MIVRVMMMKGDGEVYQDGGDRRTAPQRFIPFGLARRGGTKAALPLMRRSAQRGVIGRRDRVE